MKRATKKGVLLDVLGKANHAMVFDTEDIKVALERHRGIVRDAAQDIGMSPRAMYNRIEVSKDLQDWQKTVRDGVKDWVENKLFSLIEKNQPSAVIFAAKCLLKDRDYVERAEITGKDGKELAEVVAPVRALTPAEWKEQNAA
jgi:hypothetical protein